MTLALTMLARISGSYTAAPDSGTASAPIAESVTIDFADGTGANQANAIFVDAIALASGASTSIDLAGSLTDPLNQTKVFTAIKAILIEADAANTTDLTVGNGTNPFVGPFGAGTETQVVKPGGLFAAANPSAAGWAVTAGSADVLKIANGSGATANFRITLIGEA